MYLKQHEFTAAAHGLQAQIHALEKEIDSISGGRIICRKTKNRIRFSERIGDKEHTITRNTDRIWQLTRKHYIQEELEILHNNLDTLMYCKSNYIDADFDVILSRLADHHPLLPAESILTNYKTEKNSWADEPYEKNPFHPEHLKFITTNGTLVRSKSERDIANALQALNIPHKYDMKITCGDQVYYADFVIQCPDGRIVIWEHFGRTDDKVYCAKNEVRIKDYIAMGYRPWKNLIWTTESDMHDPANIRKIIDRFILLNW